MAVRRYVMTARRRAALRKAQLASARKRRKTARSTYKKRKSTAKMNYKTTKSQATRRWERAVNMSYKRNKLAGYDQIIENANRIGAPREGAPLTNAISSSIQKNMVSYANMKYAKQLDSYHSAQQRASINYHSTVRSAKINYKNAKRTAKVNYRKARRG